MACNGMGSHARGAWGKLAVMSYFEVWHQSNFLRREDYTERTSVMMQTAR